MEAAQAYLSLFMSKCYIVGNRGSIILINHTSKTSHTACPGHSLLMGLCAGVLVCMCVFTNEVSMNTACVPQSAQICQHVNFSGPLN